MEWYDWTKEFQDDNLTEDIPAKMQKAQAAWTTIKIMATCGMTLCLVLVIPFAFFPLPIQGVLVFGALACLIALAGSRIRLDIRLAMYHILMEWQKNLSAELRKSEAEDL